MTMTTPIFSMTPDFTPLMRMMQLQTRFAMEASQGMMKLAMMPWAGMPTGFGSICTPMGSVTVAASVKTTEKTTEEAEPAPVEDVLDTVVIEATAEPVAKPEVAVEETVAEPVAETAAEPVLEPAAAPAAAPEKSETAPAAEPAAAPEVAAVEAAADPAMVKPAALKAPKGEADDLTVLNGVGPKLAEALNAEGIYHFSQIAAWTGENVAWVDENLAGVRGRASRNGWVAQAAELVK
ncbi:hypothetical protein KZZ07_16110 [Mameliella sp. CS4]|uniref:hypothetical protein n=1 Tax=Mameliella sp. CS4 TaxID=2862329 RepID=UPI001C5DC981|nr:hypothetical protein [Mameliella sp. CS4]MBW4984067.1 hypothetical protein [Mameliella sp. CS4]